MEDKEKSQTVFFANLKEGIQLQRELHLLDKTENTAIHYITMEQRLVNKRFQQKRLRSDIMLARIFGNREREKELRSGSQYHLNTNCWNTNDDFSRKYITSRPKSTATKETPLIRVRSAPVSRSPDDGTVPSSPEDVRSCRNKDVIRKHPRGRHGIRPLTTVGIRNTQKATLSPRVSFAPRSAPSFSLLTDEDKGHRGAINQDDFLRQVAAKELEKMKRPKSCIPSLKNETKISSEITESPGVSPRSSHNKSPIMMTVLTDNKLSLLDRHKERIKSACFDERVKKFCQSLKPLTAQTSSTKDYYAKRLLDSNAQPRILRYRKMLSVSDDEAKRCIGNIYCESLTLKHIMIPHA